LLYWATFLLKNPRCGFWAEIYPNTAHSASTLRWERPRSSDEAKCNGHGLNEAEGMLPDRSLGQQWKTKRCWTLIKAGSAAITP
jgi:hypothetical protein